MNAFIGTKMLAERVSEAVETAAGTKSRVSQIGRVGDSTLVSVQKIFPGSRVTVTGPEIMAESAGAEARLLRSPRPSSGQKDELFRSGMVASILEDTYPKFARRKR